MTAGPELLLIGAVAAVGVLHTIVPDHWVPITLIARQRGWSYAETARASFQAGIGHVVSTLLIAAVVWLAGVAVAIQFGHVIDTAASIALVVFGGWIAISAWQEVSGRAVHGHSRGHGHGHSHAHDFKRLDRRGVHGPELQRVPTDHGDLLLSIHEASVPPRFRLTGPPTDSLMVETLRPDGTRQIFLFANHGTYLESVDQIPEPHGFDVTITIGHGGYAHAYQTVFAEHDHGHGHDHDHAEDHDHEKQPAHDPLYAPLRGDVAVLTRHVHVHRHGRGAVHTHWHDHTPETAHTVTGNMEAEPPLHEHRHKTTARTALLLILGSSPMVEGIPAFFAASRFGIGLIVVMSIVFAISTIATYVLLCVYSTAGLQRLRLGAFERYGEVLSGAFIALVGVAFWIWPVL
jgi:nickel/cobalt transporter (NicO) family protein